jgi:hypothetical protein
MNTLDTKARLIAHSIVVTAGEIAPDFRRSFTTGSRVSAEDVVPQIQLELCALYLHALERVARAQWGEACASFVSDLCNALVERLEEENEVSTELFSLRLRFFIEARQKEYSIVKELMPDPGGDPVGTLFWEFGKKMGFAYQGYNFIAVQTFALATCDGFMELAEELRRLGL